MELLFGTIQSSTVLAIGLIFAFAALGTAIGFALLGGKFIESSARQPEMMGALQTKLFIIAGLLDAVSIIAVAMGMLLMFANPLLPKEVSDSVKAKAKVAEYQANKALPKKEEAK